MATALELEALFCYKTILIDAEIRIYGQIGKIEVYKTLKPLIISVVFFYR